MVTAGTKGLGRFAGFAENLQKTIIAAVESIQTASVKAGTDRMSLKEINAEIEAVRRKRAR